jgi:alpha-mannosidase
MQVQKKTITKVAGLCTTYKNLIFVPVGELGMTASFTQEHLRTPPELAESDIKICKGHEWGGAGENMWLQGSYKVAPEIAGTPLYFRVLSGSRESMLFSNGKPIGIYNNLFTEEGVRSNHHILQLTPDAKAGEVFDLAAECYAGHVCVGTQPRDERTLDHLKNDFFDCVYDGSILMHKDLEVNQFVTELTVLTQMADSKNVDDFLRAKIKHALKAVFVAVEQFPEHIKKEEWILGIRNALVIMEPLLKLKNGDSGPSVGFVGHSHMDTCWLWTVGETIRKCARTYSNALNLMRQYPEYRFVQSSSYHLKMMEKHYPVIFEEIKERVIEGRWEPNGGSWIEPDGNIPSGESFIRNFIVGQAYTKEKFDYTSDTFWLPDTFGYNAALPQILRGCGLKYFTTTKLTWNETSVFPYDTFYWKGIDQTEVLAHFNWTHCAPDPETLLNYVYGESNDTSFVVRNGVMHKDVSDRRLVSYGLGDGGGGPEYEMIEMAEYCKDLQGCPKGEHMSVSDFMLKLETECPALPVFSGELYVEGHRGTLTTIAAVKRWNRKLEAELHNLEFLDVCRSIAGEKEAHKETFAKLWNDVLINQFHDILPGTSIPEATDWSLERYEKANERAQDLKALLLENNGAEGITAHNSLSWTRKTFTTDAMPSGQIPSADGVSSQSYENIAGKRMTYLSGVELPSMGASLVALKAGEDSNGASPFKLDGSKLETPFYTVSFSEDGYMLSLFDKAAKREVCGGRDPLNTFYIGEDAPAMWDNWDIDHDQKLKMKAVAGVKVLKVVSDGELMFRLRSEYNIGQSSQIIQDMVFYADRPQIDFETEVDWKEKHQLLKAGFDVNIQASQMRNEIQFGHVLRPTHENFTQDMVRFEVCNHKWTDISESRYGVALLNDCKYGISVSESDMRLTLIKSGTHPDPRGDEGMHNFTYSLLPHQGGFNTESVTQAAYELNNEVVVSDKAAQQGSSLATVDQSNIIIEAVKRSEDGASIVFRLYEAECNRTAVNLAILFDHVSVSETNMLEEEITSLDVADGQVNLEFKPFEIKTIKVKI